MSAGDLITWALAGLIGGVAAGFGTWFRVTRVPQCTWCRQGEGRDCVHFTAE